MKVLNVNKQEAKIIMEEKLWAESALWLYTHEIYMLILCE